MTQGLRLVTQPGIQRSLLPLQQQQADTQAAVTALQGTITQLQDTLTAIAPLLDPAELLAIIGRLDALAAALAGKAAAGHSHQTAEIADLAAALAGKAAAVHTHPATDITGLTMGGTFAGNLKFPVIQSPSFDPNTLDDYEEGVFSPSLMVGGYASGITYAVRSARYIKIGRLVNIQLAITLTSKGTRAGTVTIEGLPFPAITSTAEASVCIGFSNLGVTLMGYIPSNTNRIILVNTSGIAISNTNLSDFAVMKISVSYETAS
jgi:Phage tail repeat like